MDTNCRSVGHAGGTCVPLTWARGSQKGRFWTRGGSDLVPQRAPRRVRIGSTVAGFCGFCRLHRVRSAAGHASPAMSARVQRRA
jgi:hypothetical protein